MPLVRLSDLNDAPSATFIRVLGGVVEHAAWVIVRIAPRRPFPSIEALCQAIANEILAASDIEKLTLLRGHPELAGAEAVGGQMTVESTGEQGRLGLSSLNPDQHRRLRMHNAAYITRFGFQQRRRADLLRAAPDAGCAIQRHHGGDGGGDDDPGHCAQSQGDD
jgi:2-oxo-4-hydroxy-4-carboxy-5-ureidoimidazoline decarboxylase